MMREKGERVRVLEQRQYKNDATLTKIELVLNLPPFSTHLYDGQKKRGKFKASLVYYSSKWGRSYIVFALGCGRKAGGSILIQTELVTRNVFL